VPAPPIAPSAATSQRGLARLVLWINLATVLVAGLGLYALAREADEFAWTIKAPLTAAFLGAGYWGSALGVVAALRTSTWQRARIVFVLGAFLTVLALVFTLIYLDEFHLGEGSAVSRALAWFWLLLYLADPWLILAALFMYERTGGRHEYVVNEPILGWFRVVITVHVIALALVGVALWPIRADGFWPWTLPDIAAAAVGVWILTFAVGCAWALREGDWQRARPVFVAFLGFLVLLLLAALRFSEDLDRDAWQTWTYLGAILLSLVLLAAGTLRQEQIARAASSRARP
jgi:hypothetical protein